MADKRISQLAERVDIANNDVVAIVASGATVTNKATISSIQAFMQGALDVGVTSVGVTISEIDTAPISVTGSPITTSGNITINLPRATNSIRGVLDSEDFINFNNKQGTITLTTSGTSGDATFDGSLLNIPNYTTDTSGFVTLDTAQTITGIKTFGNNALQVASGGSGSFPTVIRNITVNSLISGGFNHLGFNNLNNIYFSKGSGSFNAGVFAFNNTGTRTYTLQDASGTLALTSDLNAYLPLTGGTLTGALNGTSAVFSGDIRSNAIYRDYQGEALIQTSGSETQIGTSGAGTPRSVKIFAGNSPALTLASTGAATFSSSVTVNGAAATTSLNVKGSGANGILLDENAADSASSSRLFFKMNSQTYAIVADTNGLNFASGAGANSSSGTPRLTLTSTGNVGIGTATPGAKLHLGGFSGAVNQEKGLKLTNNAGTIVALEVGGSNDSYVGTISGSNFAIRVTNSVRMTVDISGNIGAPTGTNIYNASDYRLKQNVETISNGLDKISALNPVKFNWIDGFVPSEDGKDMLGFVAQEVYEVIPEAVESFGGNSIIVNDIEIENPLRVNEKFIIPVLVKAIQELKTEIDSLKNQMK